MVYTEDCTHHNLSYMTNQDLLVELYDSLISMHSNCFYFNCSIV
jgi:hypothetical protein